ncbi:MAG: PaaI family thioesterase [Syntrophomonadaceae bacterium]
MRRLNPEHIKAVIKIINQGPYLKLLSMEAREIGEGYCQFEAFLGSKHLNPLGGIHGGVYSSLIDTATYWAVYCDVEEDISFTTLDVNVNNLAVTKTSRIIVEGKRIKVGKTICVAEANIIDNEGKHLAHGTSKLIVVPGAQTVSQLVAAIGFPPLPPKFINQD